MSWNLTGSYFESCSCDVVCPFTASLSLGATNDRCNAIPVAMGATAKAKLKSKRLAPGI